MHSNAPGTDIAATDGVVIEQQMAGASVFDLTGEAQQVNLYNLVLTWESSIRDSDTGHGIASNPPSDSDGAFPVGGAFNSQFENITVVGNDSTSYGACLVNVQQIQIRCFYVDGGDGIESNFGFKIHDKGSGDTNNFATWAHTSNTVAVGNKQAANSTQVDFENGVARHYADGTVAMVLANGLARISAGEFDHPGAQINNMKQVDNASSGDLNSGEIALDPANGRIGW